MFECASCRSTSKAELLSGIVVWTVRRRTPNCYGFEVATAVSSGWGVPSVRS
ncbi:hypothetical protein GFS60_08037 (plasmid) [Rhodococcus sp. WAY2]|nr:hypothetical protein GFS60_08037 [Rhodococcus sp. WAY2]